MAYVPPHKRHGSNVTGTSMQQLPTPIRQPFFQRKPQQNLKSYTPDQIAYADACVKKWFAVGVPDQSLLSAFTRLDPVSVESFGRNSLALVLLEENGEEARKFMEEPLSFVADTVKQDFVSSLQKLKDVINEFQAGVVKPNLVKDVMEGFEVRALRPYLVFRLGKMLFHGNQKLSLDSIRGSSLPGDTLNELRKSLNTNLPTSYMEWVTNDVVNRIGLELDCDKDVYHILIADKLMPRSTISCKCDVDKDTNRLRVYKIEINPLRNLVEDMSCLDKNLDLRLMLLTKRTLFPVTDDKLTNIKDLIACATLDSEVKGGLRWPAEIPSVDRYFVFKVWHKTSKTFTNSSMKLIIRQVHRCDYQISEGQFAQEAFIKLPKIVSELDKTFDPDAAFEMLKENLKLVWENFLCEQSST